MPRIVVNADDFGMDSDVNHAIVEAFRKGLVSSTTVMANMPGFEEACALARENGFLGMIGVHLNLTEGRPLTEPIRACARFCDELGNFRHRRRIFFVHPEEQDAVRQELDFQVKKCLQSGIAVTHVDSHHHVHTEWAIGSIVITVAKLNRIPAVRLSRNCGLGIGLLERIYKYAYNGRLAAMGLQKTGYFGFLSDAPLIVDKTTAPVELVLHPRLAPDRTLVDLDGFQIEAEVGALKIKNQLTSYAFLVSAPSARC